MSVLARAPDFAYWQVPHTLRLAGPFRRLFRSFLQWRQRRAEHDIAIHLGLTDGHISDEIERRMSERLFGGGGFRA